MAVLFQHAEHRFRIFRTHNQQAVDALLRHHRQIGLLLFEIVPRIAQNQGIAFLETALFYGFNNLSEIGRFAAGGQQANRFGVINLQAASNGTGGIVQLFDRRPHGVAGFFRHETGFVNYM